MKAKSQNLCVLFFYITCILATVDTSLFIYPSLSRSLFLELGILLMWIYVLCTSLKRGISIITTKSDLFLLVWMIYVSFHFAVSQPHELYRTLYLVVTLSLVLVIKMMLKLGLAIKNTIINGLIFIALIQIFCIILQFSGIIGSSSPYFKVVGATENPTVAAIYFVGILPLFLSRIRWNRFGVFYMFLLLLLLYSIYLLRCRTAYIGCFIAILAYAIMLRSRNNFCILYSIKKWMLVISLMTFVIFIAGIKLYSMKKDSADGRILIWKLSGQLIVEKPLGYGYGLFEKNYNLKQANYFRAEKHSYSERRNASFVLMPYNDFLEHGVEGGIVGMLFLLSFYVIMIEKALRKKRSVETAVFISFGIMSITNFVYGAILPWLVVMCMASFVMVEDDEKNIVSPLGKVRLQGVTMLGLALFSTYLISRLVNAQIELKSFRVLNEKYEVASNDASYAMLENKISTSECFWRQRANNNIKKQNYSDAIGNIHEARKYSSSPVFFMQEAICLSHIGRRNISVNYIDTLSVMIPRKLSYKYTLMRYYLSVGMHKKATDYARDIIVIGAKKETPKARKIINEAKKCLKRYEN